MANKYLARDDAMFGENVWKMLDSVTINTAKTQLTGRKLLDIEGPYGLNLKSVPLHDKVISDGDVTVMASSSLPLALLEIDFSLMARDLATFEETGFAPDVETVVNAAKAISAAEDSLIFQGNKKLGIEGLFTASGTNSLSLSDWKKGVGVAADDIIKAVTVLDNAGFNGPYMLALAPSVYNLLYRRYEQGNQTEIEHISTIIGTKPIKAGGLDNGGVLIASGSQFASLVIGQDMTCGFIGPSGPNIEMKITESIVPRIKVPSAVCILKA
ncbi:MAG: family 1 encapsulin nanocompartment shell protein [Armatimonadota bacterium]